MTPTDRAASRHASTTEWPDETQPGGVRVSADAGLAAAIEAVFDPRRDKVLYESDAASSEAGCGARILVRPGSGLGGALGWIDARRLLDQDYWVVLTVSSPEWHLGVKRSLKRLRHVGGRLLIVVPSPEPDVRPPSDTALAAVAELQRTGWQVVDLTKLSSSRLIAMQLLGVRRKGAPALAFLSPGQTFALRTSLADSGQQAGKRRATVNGDQIKAVVAELHAAMRRDDRLKAVIECPNEAWTTLLKGQPARSIQLASDELGDAIPWCGALSNAGCHPVLIIRQNSFMEHRQRIAQDVGRRGLRATLVVLGDPTAGADCFTPLPSIDGRILSVHATGHEASAVMRACLEAGHPTLLYLPSRPAHSGSPDFAAPVTAPQDSAPSTATSQATGTSRASSPRSAAARRSVWRPSRPETRQIRTFPFSDFERRWMRGYRRVGKRDLYLWRWTGCAVDWLTLSCVDQALRRNVCETKFLAAMFNVLLDDLIDERHDAQAMRDVMRLMSDDNAAADVVGRLGQYGQFTREVWTEIWQRAARYPRFNEFRRLLLYDFRQLGNTVDYSELLYRHPSIINQTEHDLYSPHGMMVACAATLDLMCSPGFEVDDLGRLREVLWHANSMARIGNLMSTWEREIGDDDFSSGMFAHAVSEGWLQPGDLSSANRVRIEAAVRDSGGEREYVERWNRHRERLLQMGDRVRSVSVALLAEGLDRLFVSEQVSRGKK